ncbi:MAG: LytTR family DNA-binding domain-containing protein [Bacteroidia bacterium]
MKCLIVDDEPLAREVVKSYIGKLPFLEFVAEFATATHAMVYLHRHEVDLIFLDIQMPDMSGLQFLNALQKRPKVIMTTAYREYALDGFNLGVVDYLLKPIPFERFAKAVERAVANTAVPAPVHEAPKVLMVQTGKKLVKLEQEAIIYIEGMKDYARLHLRDKRVITKQTLISFERELPIQFCRIHKSYIANLNLLEEMEGRQLKVAGINLPIGKSYQKALKEKIEGLMI